MKFVWVFAVAGIAALAGAAALQQARLNDQTFMATAQAQVVDLRDGCPTVEFYTDSGAPILYRSNTCSTPPAFEYGETVNVFYAPENPANARIDSFVENWLGSLILGGFGAIALLVSLLILIPAIQGRRRAVELQRTGQPVEADIVEVSMNRMLTINGRSPWKIVAQWQDPTTRKLHVFKSQNLWFDPSRFVADLKQVRVFIDRRDPKRYSMDTGFLPTIAR
ncbi:DUF3592 domain-containing protein [Pseudomonas sp. Marseille-QA0892]